MAQFKTPGVYIVEEDAFPNSVVQTPTGIPLFVGYTEKAENAAGETLIRKPTRITSLMDYHSLFGGAPASVVDIVDEGEVETYRVTEQNYFLYRAVQMFYANGGGPAFIASVGVYGDSIDATELKSVFSNDTDKVALKVDAPDIFAIPDAAGLASDTEAAGVYQTALTCAEREEDSRFVLMDLTQGDRELASNSDFITQFQTDIGNNRLKYGAAYYPWLRTSLVSQATLAMCSDGVKAALKAAIAKDLEGDDARITELQGRIDAATTPDAMETANAAAMSQSTSYVAIMKRVLEAINLQPTAGAIAGVYTSTDVNEGVFKAPANTSMVSVVAPAVQITDQMQQNLNVPINGKAINAIRTFLGRGVLIWGARTLDGNSNDWRYINVRRTLMMFERSARAACQPYVFAPNTAQTWVTVRSMLENFLNNQWKAGALAGSTPEEAYSVAVGLGETMTSEDVLNGFMNVQIRVAVVRPAEFIILTFQQKMQTS